MSMVIPYIFPVELFLATGVYLIPLPKRRHWPVRLLCGVLLYLLGPWAYDAAMTGVYPAHTWVYSPFYGLFFLFIFLEDVGVVYLCCALSLAKAIHCVAFSYATQHFTNCLCRLVLQIDNPVDLGSYSPAYGLLYLVLYFAAYVLFARRLTREHPTHQEEMHSIQYALITLLVTLVLSLTASSLQRQSPALYRVTLVYAMFCCVTLLYGQLYQTRSLQLESELALQRQLWQERKSQYDLSRENIALIIPKVVLFLSQNSWHLDFGLVTRVWHSK